jgi:hypothetical protein
LLWLEAERRKTEWTIAEADDGSQTHPLTLERLEEIADGLPLPAALRVFAARPDLQRRVRSATGCYLDLGALRARTSVSDGYLVHLLSDQQWCLHWLLYLDARGNEGVVATALPVGFDILPDDGWDLPPEVLPLDGSAPLDLCAGSFSEFLYRFWLENELFFALQSEGPLSPQLQDYAAQLAQQGPAS